MDTARDGAGRLVQPANRQTILQLEAGDGVVITYSSNNKKQQQHQVYVAVLVEQFEENILRDRSLPTFRSLLCWMEKRYHTPFRYSARQMLRI